MAKQLPYHTQPQPYEVVTVGNESIGSLQIKKLGTLAPNEQRYIKQLSAKLPDLKKEAVKLAQKIAKELGLSAVDTHTALVSGNTEMLADYLEDVVEFQSQMELVAEERQQYLATAILRYRVDPEWTVDDTGNADLIHPELAQEVALFAINEENGWAEADSAEAEPLTEDDLGKS